MGGRGGGGDQEALEKAQAAIVAAPPVKPAVHKAAAQFIVESAPKAVVKPHPTIHHTASGYTLQFFASHDRVHAERFMRKHQLRGIATLATAYRKGQVWYIVRCGNYPSRDAALLALDQMALAVQALQPWATTLDA